MASAGRGADARQSSRIRLRVLGLIGILSIAGSVSLLAIALNSEELGAFLDTSTVVAVPLGLATIALLTVLLIPGSVLAGGAGFALGTALGYPTALAGLVAGATVAAAAARVAGTEKAAYAFGERVERSVRWLERRPFHSVAIARLVPGMPFNFTSYACGLSAIPLGTVAAATLVGYAPRCLAYTALGGSLDDLTEPEAQAAVVVSVVLLLALAAMPRIMRRHRS